MVQFPTRHSIVINLIFLLLGVIIGYLLHSQQSIPYLFLMFLLGVIIGYLLHGYPPFEGIMQRMHKSIRDHVKHNLRWCIYAIISILLGILIYYLRIPEGDVSSIIIILETIPILLATTFSLFFTTIFIIAQIMRRGYVKIFNLMGDKFRNVFLSYLVGIIFPLLVLKSGINILEEFGIGNTQITNLSVTTSMTIMIFCLLIVIDYLGDMREFMRKDAIPRLIKEAMSAIDTGNERGAEEIIRELLRLFR